MIGVLRKVYVGGLLFWLLVVGLMWPWITSGPESGILLTAALVSLGVIVFGAAIRFWNWRTGPKDDRFVIIVWSLSLWQVIAWPCLVFSGSWMVSEVLASAILAAGLLAGLAYGAWSIRRHIASAPSPPAPGPLATATAGIAPALNDERRSPVSALAWFTAGLIGGLCLTFAVAWVESFFRGPVLGYNEIGGIRYAEDQFFVNLNAGLAIVTIAGITAAGLRRAKAPRGLMCGILAGAVPLGVLHMFGF